MRALDSEVVDALWAAFEIMAPPADQSHPLGCHRPRVLIGCAFGGRAPPVTHAAARATLDRQVSDV
ncbi:MAG: hypothetical protein ACR2MB_16305 [Acidimicrobiales bacterium]